jgi:NAD(P)-dependent dehydrogenase (short-subunit alcohol dehydrogenase family)
MSVSEQNGFTAADVQDLSGKCFIVTGANSGIGFHVSRVLAENGARVLLACRDKTKAYLAMARITHARPDANVSFLPLDLADLSSIRSAAMLASRESRIDGLINNAGIMMPPLSRTLEGFELQFGVNHLGCFALTSLLLPKLSETPGARVVVTSSLAHRNARIDWNDLDANTSYNAMKRYAASKLANALFLFELDRRLRATQSPVIAVGCHPGIAATELGRHSRAFRRLNPVIGKWLNSAEQGAWPALQATTVLPAPITDPWAFLDSRVPRARLLDLQMQRTQCLPLASGSNPSP